MSPDLRSKLQVMLSSSDPVERRAAQRRLEMPADPEPDPVQGEVAIAAVEVQPRIDVSESIRATRLGFKRCWFSTTSSTCGCSGVECHLKKRIVTLGDCVTCLRRW